MQSVLMVRSSAGGLIYLNGRLAGEAEGEHPLTLPVSPGGVVFLELHPFVFGYLPFAVRIPISGGVPNFPAPDPRMYAACWPGGLIELELRPERVPAPAQILFREREVCFSYIDASPPVLRCDSASDSFFYSLPDGAMPPALTVLPSALLLRGTLTSSEEYALLLSADTSRSLLTLIGRNISVTGDGTSVRILRPQHDTVGHAFLETWSETREGWKLTLSEPMWADGAPVWPRTPADTALAAIEAAQLRLMSEAASYCSPLFSCAGVLSRLAEFDGCTALRVPLPDGAPAVGVTKLEGGLLRVIPVRYAASAGGAHGLWQLESLEIDEMP